MLVRFSLLLAVAHGFEVPLPNTRPAAHANVATSKERMMSSVRMLSDGAAAAGGGVLVITIASGALIFRDAAGGSRASTPAFRNADATAAALVSLATALCAAFLVNLAFAPPAGAIVVLPKTNEQKEQSASRARALTAAAPAFPIQAAQGGVDALLADEETFRAIVAMGLPTGSLQMPPRIEKGVFLNLELSATDPTALRAAAEAYTQDAAKAEEYLTYAEGAQLQGDNESIRANLDAAFAAVQRCKTSLQRVLASC